jgi:hypothetical protein
VIIVKVETQVKVKLVIIIKVEIIVNQVQKVKQLIKSKNQHIQIIL